MATIGRRAYAEQYGPTVGDRVRLADTALVIEVERDLTLAAGSYAAGAVRVRQIDAAGNNGTVSGLAALTVDTTAPATVEQLLRTAGPGRKAPAENRADVGVLGMGQHALLETARRLQRLDGQ